VDVDWAADGLGGFLHYEWKHSRAADLRGRTFIGFICENWSDYKNGGTRLNVEYCYQFALGVRQIEPRRVRVETAMIEEIDPTVTFNHEDFCVESLLDRLDDLGRSLERFLAQTR
jgi:hypothetical protein